VRILIAEDDPVIGLGLKERVAALGHEPIGPVPDGAQAIAKARAEPPDLYLFDIDMPVMDGLAAAAQLTTEGLRRPVVVITGIEDPDLIERSIASGVSAYLAKPINERELDAAIRLAFTRHHEYLALENDVTQARQALSDRKIVEQAKGTLTEALGISEPEAFKRIQRAARDRNLKLVEIARRIIEQSDLITAPRDPSTSAGRDRGLRRRPVCVSPMPTCPGLKRGVTRGNGEHLVARPARPVPKCPRGTSSGMRGAGIEPATSCCDHRSRARGEVRRREDFATGGKSVSTVGPM